MPLNYTPTASRIVKPILEEMVKSGSVNFYRVSIDPARGIVQGMFVPKVGFGVSSPVSTPKVGNITSTKVAPGVGIMALASTMTDTAMEVLRTSRTQRDLDDLDNEYLRLAAVILESEAQAQARASKRCTRRKLSQRSSDPRVWIHGYGRL